MMIRAFRMRGHLHANLDPLGLEPEREKVELLPETFGFTEADLDRPIFIDNVLGLETATIREIVSILKRTYCSTIGFEFMHVSDPDEKAWMQLRIEGPDKSISFTREGKRAILNKLVEAEGFEKFLDVRYTGTKRFGLDGAEAMIPALEQIIKRGGALGVREIVLGMAHRGRLNVLSQVMGKPHRAIFNEFKGGSASPQDVEGSGDVKYHLGASSDREFDGNKVHLSLTANPSHLEIVDPVVLGKVRAKQDQLNDQVDRETVMPLLLHGDAAFAGQGVIAECFGLSGLKGHKHRRLGAFHHQQPDRLHDLSALLALVALSLRRRQDDRGADLPRERRRPGGRHLRGEGRGRVPAALPQAGRHRHVLLPPLRAQRGRRAELHPAPDVQDHPEPQVDARTLCGQLVAEGVVSSEEVDAMKADLAPPARRASSRPPPPTGRTRPTGSTAAGSISSPPRASRTRNGGGAPASSAKKLVEIGTRLTACRTASRRTRPSGAFSTTAGR